MSDQTTACVVSGCGRPIEARRLCPKHYQSMRTHLGGIAPDTARGLTEIERVLLRAYRRGFRAGEAAVYAKMRNG